jgi:hypothetical protein
MDRVDMIMARNPPMIARTHPIFYMIFIYNMYMYTHTRHVSDGAVGILFVKVRKRCLYSTSGVSANPICTPYTYHQRSLVYGGGPLPVYLPA